MKVKITRKDDQENVSKKENGYLSIEKVMGAEDPKFFYFVYRNYLGSTQFTGIITNSKQVTIHDDEVSQKADGKFKVKASILQKDVSSGKFINVEVEIGFISDLDKKTFVVAF